MRKLFVSLLLPLVMLFTQQAQAWHEIGHLRGPSGTTEQQQKQDALGDKLCSLCFSFAHIDATAPAPNVPAFVPAPAEHAAPTSVAVISHASPVATPGNRDPPANL